MAPPSFESLQSPTCVVCLVDDDAEYCLLVEIIFRRNMPSYSLCLFDSGQTFLDALPELSADLIILDQPEWSPNPQGVKATIPLPLPAGCDDECGCFTLGDN